MRSRRTLGAGIGDRLVDAMGEGGSLEGTSRTAVPAIGQGGGSGLGRQGLGNADPRSLDTSRHVWQL